MECKYWVIIIFHRMMTSSNGNIFHVTGHLCGEFTSHRWIPCTKDSVVELLMFSLICALNKWLSKQSWDCAYYEVIIIISVEGCGDLIKIRNVFETDFFILQWFRHSQSLILISKESEINWRSSGRCHRQTIVAYWRHVATQILANIGSVNGLLPDGTKPLAELTINHH